MRPTRSLVFALFVLALVGFGGAHASSPSTRVEQVANMRVATGSFVGNGIDNRAISGVGFQPDVVLVKGTNNEQAVIHTATMPDDLSKEIASGSNQSGAIKTLDADGFTLGTNARVNRATAPNTFYWIAFQAAPGQMALGTYTGNGDAQTIGGVGFAPDYVIVLSSQSGHNPLQRSSATSGTTSYFFSGNQQGAHGITALNGDGFKVGGNANVNRNGTQYHYLAWKNTAGSIKVGSYLGNSTGGNPVDNRNITGVGFQPDWVLVRKDGGSASRPLHRSAAVTGDAALEFIGNDPLGDSIQQLNADGFQVGTDTLVNSGNGCSGPCTYFYVAFRDGGNVATATPTPTEVATETATDTPTETTTVTPSFTATPTDIATAIPTPPDSFTLIEQAVAESALTLDTATLYKVYALFGDPQLPSEYYSTTLIPDEGTAALLYALKDWEQLSPETRQTIADYLTPRQITGTVPAPQQENNATPRSRKNTRTATPVPTQTPKKSSAVAPPRALTKGIYHIRGVIQRVDKSRLIVKTARGMLRIRLTAKSYLRSTKGLAEKGDFKPGAIMDGLVRINAKSQAQAIRLNLVKEGDPARLSLPEQESNNDPGGSFANLADGLGWSQVPAVAVDDVGNVTVVWYSDGAPAGLWMRTKSVGSSTWSSATHIGFTSSASWLPSLATDSAGALHLVWEESVGDTLEIRYARGAWNETGTSVNWGSPQSLASGSFGYNGSIGATQGNGTNQIHATWVQVDQVDEFTSTSRVMYAQGDAATGVFGGALELFSTSAYLELTSGTSRATVPYVGVGYIALECDGNGENCAELKYQECSLTAANGNCAEGGWSGAEIASADANSPSLTFDTTGNAHLAWQGPPLVSGYGILHRANLQSGGWSDVTVFDQESSGGDFSPVPVVGAGGVNNVYLGWNHFYATPYELRLAHNDGTWGNPQTFSSDMTGISMRWGSLIVDASQQGHLVWEGASGQIYYSTLGTAIPTATPTATVTPTSTPTSTHSPTPTITPTVTPNAGGIPRVLIGPCDLDTQIVLTHFVIWYQANFNQDRFDCRITGGSSVEYLANIGSGLEAAFYQYQAMGYQLPTELPYQVYIVPMGALGGGITFSPQYTFITNEFRADGQPLAAHEFFHAAQWVYQEACPQFDELQVTWAWYDNEDLRWWMEATAQWAQHEAIGVDTSYTDFITAHLNEAWAHMDTRPILGGTGIPYSVLFPFYLIEHFGGNNTIRTSWENYRDFGDCGAMLPVLDITLPPNATVASIFPDYAEQNYFLSYQEPQRTAFRNSVQGGNAFRPSRDERDLDDQHLAIVGPNLQEYPATNIERLGTAYVELHPRFAQNNQGRDLRIEVSVGAGDLNTPPVVRIWRINQAAPPMTNLPTILIPLQYNNLLNSYSGSVIVPDFDQYQWVAMEVVNPQSNLGNGLPRLWEYSADVLP